ncbi:hypothetical protein [Tardibacter chloracetimidivorans]|nr:hypothetical protein [Tardibacter chloracetimidivorans]
MNEMDEEDLPPGWEEDDLCRFYMGMPLLSEMKRDAVAELASDSPPTIQ